MRHSQSVECLFKSTLGFVLCKNTFPNKFCIWDFNYEYHFEVELLRDG